jgi:hypothetical protein
MTVTLSGLDLSWMNDPANRLPPAPPKPRIDHRKRAEGIAIPAFMPDIKPFVAHATKTPVEITSRSVLRRYEIGNGLKQAGDLPVGQIVKENRAKHDAEMKLIKEHGGTSAWTDFSLPETA